MDTLNETQSDDAPPVIDRADLTALTQARCAEVASIVPEWGEGRCKFTVTGEAGGIVRFVSTSLLRQPHGLISAADFLADEFRHTFKIQPVRRPSPLPLKPKPALDEKANGAAGA